VWQGKVSNQLKEKGKRRERESFNQERERTNRMKKTAGEVQREASAGVGPKK